MMITRSIGVALALMTTLLVGCGTNGKIDGAAPLVAVDELDLARYAGRWYEIARYPTSFQRGLVGVTAEYSVRKDGKLKVLNGGFKGTLGGKRSESTGKAWAPDPEHPERLKVQFFWPFKGDYWVIDLDPDYQWAMVGERSRNYLWILSRTPELSDETVEALMDSATALGYRTDLLTWTPQPPGG